MNLSERIKSFEILGRFLNQFISESFVPDPDLETLNVEFKEELLIAIEEAEKRNPWFTSEFIRLQFRSVSGMLGRTQMEEWVKSYYHDGKKILKPSKIGIVMAGNIPLVGFHDFLSVLISGHRLSAKLSSKDAVLFPLIRKILVYFQPGFEHLIEFTENSLSDMNAVIATGSDNSSRYFEYYFGKYPHIIRKNRNSAAVLTGQETEEELKLLADDVFMFFGLGCRNVSKIYLPEGYNPGKILDHFSHYSHLAMHNKFANNHDYQRSVLLLNGEKFLDNDFLILRENPLLSSPVACLHYEFYDDPLKLKKELLLLDDKIQCVISRAEFIDKKIEFGQSQFPSVNDYADNADTMEFLRNLYA